jgi:cytochrome c biogenesis protein CcmG/thiol:disulfide interchange protein DsbE
VVFAVALWLVDPGATGELDPGQEAPDVELATEGGPLALAAQRGHPMVINFWASWCPPCRAEAPTLAAAHRRLGEENDGAVWGFGMDGVAIPELTSRARALGMSFPVGPAPEEAVRAYGVRVLPSTFVLDRSGRIVAAFEGAVSEQALDEALARASAP